MHTSPPSDVSVVVQGPIYRVPNPRGGLNMTEHVLKSVRHALPGCEIILSTWDHEDVSGLEYDVLVRSPDPGPCDYFIQPNENVNRQTVSTLAGLKLATRPLAVKLRSDCIIEYPSFLDYQHRYPERGPGPNLFRNKIVCSNMGTADFRKWRIFFGLNDYFFFGNTDDLLLLWDIPLVRRPPGEEPRSAAIVTEQHIAIEAMRKAGFKIETKKPWGFNYRWYFRRYWLTWERFLFGNFNLAHPHHLGLLLSRRLEHQSIDYPFMRADALYEMHCCRPDAWLPLPWRELLLLAACYIAPPRQ